MPDPLPQLNQSIIPHNSTLVVGLSGGPDSIYLAYQLANIAHKLNIKIIAAHLDHEWQASSPQAVEICKQACLSLGIELIVKKRSELQFQAKWNGSQEEIGRKMRRYFFESIAQEHQASAIALAHHAQDQQETFFIRLIRGASLQGLAGIQATDGLYIRPILNVNKQDILSYVNNHNIPYYTDPTNVSDTYLRNRIRNHVIPTLQKIDARFEQKLSETIDHIKEVNNFLQEHAEQVLTSITTCHGVEIASFLSLNTIIQQRILLHLLIEEKLFFTPSQNLFKEIMRFLEKSSAKKHIIYETCFIQKNKSYFMIKKNDKNL